jgi:peptidoglycan/xylan/chitin deacetylase (PgdA/CDA1 family)
MPEHMIDRRRAIKLLGLGSTALLANSCFKTHTTYSHIITLSFDDGFEKSTWKTVEIYEKYGLKACVNVIATAHEKDFQLPNEYHRWPAGDFEMWNELKRRGHEVMPHSLKHQNLQQVSFEVAQKLIMKCLDVFSEKLDGFKPRESIYNFAHNASTSEIEKWLGTKVRAFRTGGAAVNPLPYDGMTKLTCISKGPENIDRFLDKEIEKFLSGPSGWFIFNTHGLDDEGWGPISSGYLDELLDRLSKTKDVELLPVATALDKANKSSA